MQKLRYLKVVVLFLILILMLSTLKGQDLKQQFDQFKQEQKSGYNQFVDQMDREFANFLRENWQTFEVHSGHLFQPRPKPDTFPKAHKIIPEPTELGLEPATPDKLDIKPELVMPVNYKSSTYEGIPAKAKFEFYGDEVSVNYDPKIKVGIEDDITPKSMADYWQQLSETDYRQVLDDLFAFKKKYGLNDYGFYLLVKNFGNTVASSENEVRLLTWFILSKFKYKVKIGYNADQLYLLLPCMRKVYGLSYFIHNDIPFYAMDYHGEQIFSYEKDYPAAYKTMDFSLSKNLNLKENFKTKKLALDFRTQHYDLDVSYNKNAIDFYQDIPSLDLDGYFNAELTVSTQRSLIENLHPIIAEMSELEAVGFLLALVQNGFEYKVDEDQFGREKVFFPEEMLHYPYSDCDDRAVFFAYLVNTLLGNEVIGLDYPSHVATAVHFQGDVSGDYFMVNDKKFIVCDPTYVNAPVGMSMRDLSNYNADIIRKERRPLTPEAFNHFKSTLGIVGNLDEPYLIELEEGAVMSARHKQEVIIQGKKLSSSSSGTFVAAFDQNNRLTWTQNFESKSETTVVDLLEDKGSVFILHKENGSEVLILTKLDDSGNELWSNEIPVISKSSMGANTQVTLFDQAGKEVAGKAYSELATYEADPLSIRNDKIVVIASTSE